MELGDCIQETIIISPSSDIDADWYHVFSQKLISHDFIETEPYHWETSFIFTVEEKRAIKTSNRIGRATFTSHDIANGRLSALPGYNQRHYKGGLPIFTPSLSSPL